MMLLMVPDTQPAQVAVAHAADEEPAPARGIERGDVDQLAVIRIRRRDAELPSPSTAHRAVRNGVAQDQSSSPMSGGIVTRSVGSFGGSPGSSAGIEMPRRAVDEVSRAG